MESLILNEQFDGQAPADELSWYNEPSSYSIDAARGVLRVEPAPGTDFWQKTYYGFSADNGHFLGLQIPGDAVVETMVSYSFRHQYDQAGLMMRLSPECWLKASVEHEPDAPDKLGAVVTRGGFSDWSVQEVDAVDRIGFRVVRNRLDFLVYYRSADHRSGDPGSGDPGPPDRDGWKLLRMARLDEAHRVLTGLYACSPKQGGFAAEFHYLTVGVPGG